MALVLVFVSGLAGYCYILLALAGDSGRGGQVNSFESSWAVAVMYISHMTSVPIHMFIVDVLWLKY